MTNTIDKTPCPRCGLVKNNNQHSRTGLYISVEFVAQPLGSFSLAGAQMKVTGRERPVLKCRNCEFTLVGEFEGPHMSQAVFPQPIQADRVTP